MKNILSVLFVLISCMSYAQKGLEEQIEQFYSDINSGDKERVKSHFLPNGSIVSIQDDTTIDFSIDEFIKICPEFESKKYREEIERIEYVGAASRQLKYKVYFKFYIDGEFSHCGTDEFIFLANSSYQYLIDKIYSYDCDCREASYEHSESDSYKVDHLLNLWHKNVSDFNLDSYFDFMHSNFIFLGTDPSERWTKNQFYTFCKPYFDKKSTWNFTTNWRNIYFSDDGNTAWFEESLDTQMNECRGSGVLIKVDGKWKLAHYNLTVLIENEKMKKFLKLRAK